MAVNQSQTDRPFVRSIRMGIEEVVPGMIIAEDIKTPAGAILVSADTFLTRDHLECLRKTGTGYLYIETCEIPRKYDPLRGKKAIVVDVSPFFRHMFGKMLYRMGMHVCGEMESGEEAVRVAPQVRPDLVVMNIQLPKMSGCEAMRVLRRRLPDSRFIAVSSVKDRATVLESLKSGAGDFIVKPVKWDSLKPRILKLFQPRPEDNSSLS